ncbi:hypothetical protein KIN20_031680 [Parelaphostrongylus tenuis]|uniref:Uncharacterized protein n=1 Tax=Parelaphostrongylus tenuis TaxID=148309 RepID=A0AAD5R5U9_PARTN|nr:hypothetical protein KIN20_031680 [Parelaphostrongylus tenuis]
MTMSMCYARVAAIVYSSSKTGLSPAMAAFSKAATHTAQISGYSAIPMISKSQSMKTAQSTISAFAKQKSARASESNKKQVFRAPELAGEFEIR